MARYGGVGIVGDRLAQRQRPVRRQLSDQPIGERPDALVVLVGLRRGIGQTRTGPRGVVEAVREALVPASRSSSPSSSSPRAAGASSSGAHVAALDVEHAGRVDADEGAGHT